MVAEDTGRLALVLDVWESEMLNHASEDIAAAKEASGGSKHLVAVVPSPHQCRPLVPNSEPARERIGFYLDVIIEQAFRENVGPQPPRVEDDQDPLMDAACRLCRGQCCLSGYEAHAHLGVEDIQRFRRRTPSATPEEIKAHYLSFLPEERTAGGCYFQGQFGCTLPRALRSELCNTFVCRAQKLLAQAKDEGANSMVIVGAIRKWPAAVALWQETEGYRQITPSFDDG